MGTLLDKARSFLGWVLTGLITLFVMIEPAVASENIKGGAMDLIKIAEEIKGQIVQVVVPLPNGKSNIGSGFWVDRSGYVATCWHVVQTRPEAKLLYRALLTLYLISRGTSEFLITGIPIRQ